MNFRLAFILGWGVFVYFLETQAQVLSGTSKCASALSGQAAFTNIQADSPGVCRRITVADLPSPSTAPSTPVPFANLNIIPQPNGAWPKVPPGFKVDKFYANVTDPRLIRVAPNGDIFVSESKAGRIRILRAADGATSPSTVNMYASGLNGPFGIRFYPPGNNPKWIYIADTDALLRYPYNTGDMQAQGQSQQLVSYPTGSVISPIPTRDVEFTPDGAKMYLSIGGYSDDWDNTSIPEPTTLARIEEYLPNGTHLSTTATGVRNAVSITNNPTTGRLWASGNEREGFHPGVGDNLVPDYVTHVQSGGFYGWPWYYLGGNPDPRHANDSHPELKNSVVVPDTLLQAHSALLQMVFYTGSMFPSEYTGDAFVSMHGGAEIRTGYKVVRVPMVNGVATGEYQDFMTGFITDSGDVWGRPVGAEVAHDGALLVSDDASGTIWRISYTGGY